MSKHPSIFNDVIGPVMRGPSSSHTAASWRIARTSLDILDEELASALFEFDKKGAWATNFREQGTSMGINGGLLGLDITDDQMKQADTLPDEEGIQITYAISSFQTFHTNTVKLTLEGKSGKKIQIIGVSSGGGSFKIQFVDEFTVSIKGDYFELLVFFQQEDKIHDQIAELLPGFEMNTSSNGEVSLVVCKSSKKIDDSLVKEIKRIDGVNRILEIKPVMPLISGNGTVLPFDTIPSLIKYAAKRSTDLGELGMIYEKSLGGLSDDEVKIKMDTLIDIIERSIETGLNGTIYSDRILPPQSHLIKKAEKKGAIVADSLLNNVISNVTAIMESKSAMEVIVANPTAGSCGTVGGTLKAVADKLNSSKDEKISAYFAAGLIGAFFASGPGFSAEEHGCQVECGAASGMAAAGIVQLLGGSTQQAVNAASMAIQNMIGLVCDPVADRVEVPCLGKNVSAAVNAYASATMVLSGFDAVIPFDQVLQTVSHVGNHMPACHKCTGTGGLAITEASKKLKLKLKSGQIR